MGSSNIMAEIADFVQESTATTGTGTLTLVAIAGFAEFIDAVPEGTQVYYAIKNGNNRESGIGTTGANKTLVRTTPHTTLVNGVYNNNSPSAINLVSASTVFLSATSNMLETAATGDKNYVHVQNSPLSVWNINHALNKFPAISVVDSALSEVIGDINYVDVNNVILTFSASFSGKAYFN